MALSVEGKFMSSNKKPGSEEKKHHKYMIYVSIYLNFFETDRHPILEWV